LSGITHTGPASIQIFDQSATNALATGQSQTRLFSVSEAARNNLPLRLTLVWTDPPGNPAAGVKLVNDLDLILTNLDTGDVFFGNDFRAGSSFTFASDTNTPPNLDSVNNVENVYLLPPLGSNYAVTVLARHVNVNAVTAHTNQVAQDYALVISAGDGEFTDALTNIQQQPIAGASQSTGTVVTNSFSQNGALNPVSGSLLLGQHVGANTPLLGTTNGITNQWHFYVITNTAGYSNAAFVTFLPPDLSIPRIGVREDNLDNATRLEADIDLYVSLNPALLDLDPAVLASANRSRSRGGTELVVYGNASLGQVYYIGVKSEDQMAAEYAFLGVFSQNPFDQRDQNGNLIVIGLPIPMAIPDGSPADPGAALILGLAVEPLPVRRVVLTNSFFHENPGDLLGTLSHGQKFAVLNNHRGGPPGDYTFVYEDNGEETYSSPSPYFSFRHTDGPGSLRNFVGEEGLGVWLLAMVDNSMSLTGIVHQVGGLDGLTLRLEPQNVNTNGEFRAVSPNEFTYDFIDVPVAATNLIVAVTFTSGSVGPVDLYIRQGAFPTRTQYDKALTGIISPGGALSITKSDLPPLTAGRYYIGVFNSSGLVQNIRIVATVQLDLNSVIVVPFASAGNEPLLDDAVTNSITVVPNDATISTIEVGLRVDHPRISDLAFTLISPGGTRVLLMENRGGTDASGAGATILVTNTFNASATGGPAAVTNFYDVGTTAGSIPLSYEMFPIPDQMTIYYSTNQTPANLITNFFTSGAGQFNVTFPPPGVPPTSTFITIVMNQTNHPPATRWLYTFGGLRTNFLYLTFTENTNRATVPIKFLPPPFVPANTVSSNIWADDFEGYAVATYSTNTSFGGWTILTNQVAISSALPANTGLHYLAVLDGAAYTNLPTVAGRTYVLSYAQGSSASDPNETITNAGWQAQSLSFTAVRTSTPLVLNASGNPNLANRLNGAVALTLGTNDLVDDFVLTELPADIFAFPEQSLDRFIGENAKGPWKLEVWDSRVGATNNVSLQSWRMNIVFQTVTPLATPLTHGVAQTNSVPPGQIAYYTVDVPAWARFATNQLLFASGPVSVLFNQNTPPTTATPPDYLLIGPGVTSGSYMLSTNSAPPPPPLLPGARYYLGVSNASAAAVTYALEVDFNVTPLFNAVSLASAISPGTLPRYFSYDVSTNAIAVDFELFNLSGDLNLVARKGTPLPTLGSFDYGSFNSGTNNEDILVFTNSSPVPLSAGRWYLGVFNADPAPVSYSIRATELTNLPTIILLTNAIAYANTNSGAGNATDFYRYNVSASAGRVEFELFGLSGNLTLVARKGLPPPSLASNDYSSANGGTTDELIVVFTNSTPVALSPGNWFLCAVNVSGGPASYSIRATEYQPIITLTDGVPYFNTNAAFGSATDYYLYTVSTNAERVDFEILGPTANMTLVAHRGLPLPSLVSFDYLSANPGINDELIVILTNSTPVALAPGDWYLAAINVSGTPADYTIKATESASAPITGRPITIISSVIVSNSFCLTWTSVPGVRYHVDALTSLNSTNWVTLSPTITAAAVLTTWCVPLPSPYHFFRVLE